MDYSFTCPFCHQELVGDDSTIGQEIQWPSCKGQFEVPAPPQRGGLTVPHRTTTAQIQKANKPLDITAKGDKKLQLKTFRHADCLKDGKDRFDETVTAFLQRVGEGNIVSLHAIQYTIAAKDGKETDYGVVVYFKE